MTEVVVFELCIAKYLCIGSDEHVYVRVTWGPTHWQCRCFLPYSCTTTTTAVTVLLAGVRCRRLFSSLLPCLTCRLPTFQTHPLYAPCTCIFVPLYDRSYATYRHAPRIAVPRGTSGVFGPGPRPPPHHSHFCLLSGTRRWTLFLKRRSDLSLSSTKNLYAA